MCHASLAVAPGTLWRTISCVMKDTELEKLFITHVAPGTLWRTISCVMKDTELEKLFITHVAPGTLWRTISQRLCGAAPLKE